MWSAAARGSKEQQQQQQKKKQETRDHTIHTQHSTTIFLFCLCASLRAWPRACVCLDRVPPPSFHLSCARLPHHLFFRPSNQTNNQAPQPNPTSNPPPFPPFLPFLPPPPHALFSDPQVAVEAQPRSTKRRTSSQWKCTRKACTPWRRPQATDWPCFRPRKSPGMVAQGFFTLPTPRPIHRPPAQGAKASTHLSPFADVRCSTERRTQNLSARRKADQTTHPFPSSCCSGAAQASLWPPALPSSLYTGAPRSPR